MGGSSAGNRRVTNARTFATSRRVVLVRLGARRSKCRLSLLPESVSHRPAEEGQCRRRYASAQDSERGDRQAEYNLHGVR